MDFTDQHRRVRERATAVATGDDPVSSAAVVGVYGSGKSTLLFHLLRTLPEQGVTAVWEEAAAFVERLLPANERVPAHEFVRRVQEWVTSLKAGDGMESLASDLEARGRHDIARAIRKQTEFDRRAVLLLDEMEQAYEMLRERVRTDDRNPLRALLDSCGDDLALIVAYAPESFLSLGDADKGRHRVLHVPALRASSIAKVFELPRGGANFAWWASRGRARGVVQAIETVLKPYLAGELGGDPQELATFIDNLPPIFGVPAVVRDHIPLAKLPELLSLAPIEIDSVGQGILFDLRDELKLTETLETALMATLPADARGTVQRLLREIIAILDACADDKLKAYVPFEQLDALYALATARAQEVGLVSEIPEDWRTRAVAVLMSQGAGVLSHVPSISITKLVEEVFPSPFTDPVLPVGGRQPSRAEVDKEFAAMHERGDAPRVIPWQSRDALLARDGAAIETWLQAEGANTAGVTALLIGQLDTQQSPLTDLMRDAGRLEAVHLPSFSAEFVKSVVVSSEALPSVGRDFDERANALSTSKDLRRKINWHVERLDLVVRDARPQAQPSFEAAVVEAQAQLVPFLQRKRVRDSLALLALVPLVQDHNEETRERLSELADLLRKGRRLRKLTEGQRLLRGAGVVVDELLPTLGETGRWVYDEPHVELKALVARHSSPAARKALAGLVDAGCASSLATIFVADTENIDDPDIASGQRDLQLLTRLLERAANVRAGIADMLDEDVARVDSDIGLSANMRDVAAASADLEELRRMLNERDQIPDPWARVLTQWVVGRFASTVYARVANEHLGLKEWENCAQAGRRLGARASKFAKSLRSRNMDGLANTVERGRNELRQHLGSSMELQRAQRTFAERISQLATLAEAIVSLGMLASERGIASDELVKRYEPEEGNVEEDLALAKKTLELLHLVQDKPPAPIGGGLRSWLERLADYLSRNRIERLRARLGDLLGDAIDTRALDPVYEEEVARVEAAWGQLEDDFKDGARDEFAVHKPTSSGDLARLLDDLLAIQRLLGELGEASWGSAHDETLRDAAASGRKARSWVEEELAARQTLKEQVTNHADVTAPAAVVLGVVNAHTNYTAALKALEAFLSRVADVRSRLDELEVDVSIEGLDDSGPDPFLAELKERVTAAEAELAECGHEFESLQSLLGEFGAESSGASSQTGIKAARTLLENATGRLHKILVEHTEAAQGKASLLGVAHEPVESNDPKQWFANLAAWKKQLNEVEAALMVLTDTGARPSEAEPASAAEVLERLRGEQRAAEEQRAALRLQLETLQARGRLFGRDLVTGALPVRVDELEAAIDGAMGELQVVIKERVKDLSDSARSVWHRLQTRSSLPPQFAELLDAGLLTIVGNTEL